MKFLRETNATLRRWMTQPTTELNRWQRTLRWWIELSRYCARKLRRDRAGEKAAALTYHTLFSLLPTMVLMLVILQSFVGEDEREKFKAMAVNQILRPVSTEEIENAGPPVEGQAPAADVPDVPDAAEAAQIAARRAEYERFRHDLEDQVQAVFAYLEGVNFRSIGAVGLLIFIWGATGLLAGIEKSFNAIYSETKSRPWFMRLPLYYTVITLGPVVLIGGQYLQVRFLDLIAAYTWTRWFAGPLVVLSPVLTTWFVLSLMYVLLPNTKVMIRPALIGAFVAAALWVIAIEAMTYYISSASTASLYGALALLPLFLLWLWVTWLIVLFGLQLAYTLQMMQSRRLGGPDAPDEPMIIDPAAVVPLTAEIAESFKVGKACTIDQLTRSVNLPAGPVECMLEALEKHRLVHRVEQNGNEAFTLARPVDQVKVFELLNAMDAIAAGPKPADQPQARKLIDQLRQHADQSEQITLDRLLQ